jgi:hypothetical protein
MLVVVFPSVLQPSRSMPTANSADHDGPSLASLSEASRDTRASQPALPVRTSRCNPRRLPTQSAVPAARVVRAGRQAGRQGRQAASQPASIAARLGHALLRLLQLLACRQTLIACLPALPALPCLSATEAATCGPAWGRAAATFGEQIASRASPNRDRRPGTRGCAARRHRAQQ